MAKIPATTKTSLEQRLNIRARERQPQIKNIEVRFRAGFTHVDARLTEDAEPEALRLCRLRYGGSASLRGFATHRASRDDYEDSWLPSGWPTGSPTEALDMSCALHLNDPSAWREPPAN